MKNILFLLLLCPILSFSQGLSTNDKIYDYPPFRNCGLVTRWASPLIPPECLTEAKNVYFDEDLSVYRRKGYAQYTSACTDLKAIKGMWNFDAIDGTRYIVIFSSRAFFYTTGTGSCTPISTLTNLNATAEYECVQSLGQLWCTNGIDTPFYTNVSTFVWNTNMPLGTKIGVFRNRIITANASTQLSRIRLSAEGDGADWAITIPGTSTTPASIDISGLNDGKPITALMGQYQNSFLIARKDDLWALSGNDRRDFTLRQISSEVGVLDSRSIREKENCLVWLSYRGVEKMCGTTIERVSDPIRPIVDPIIQAAGNTRTKTYNSQSDWETGLYSVQLPGQGPLSTTVFPGSVVPSTWTHTDTEAAHWVAGTLTNISTSNPISAGSIGLEGEKFQDGNYTANPTWTVDSGNWIVSNNRLQINGTGLGLIYTSSSWNAGTISFDVLRNGNDGLAAYIISTGPVVLTQPTFDNYMYVSISATSKLLVGVQGTITTICTISSGHTGGSVLTYTVVRSGNIWTLSDSGGGNCSGTYIFNPTSHFFGYRENSGTATDSYIDNITGGFYFSTGTFTSPIFDTTFSTPVGGPFSFSETVPIGSTLAYSVRQSSFNSTNGMGSWNTVSTTTSGAYRIPFTKQYWQYKADFTTTYSTQTPTIEAVTLEATTTGYYIGDCVNTTGITSWGNFRPQTNINGNSTISFAISTGSTCNEVTRSTYPWSAQTINSPITVSTAAFLGFRVYEGPTSTTETLHLDGLTVEWNEGSARPPVASGVYRNRWYMFYTTSTVTGATNDSALVLDSKDKWSLLDNIYAYSATVYQNKFITGESRANGLLIQQDIGIDDSGSLFDFKIKTSDFDFGNAIELKKLIRIYLTLKSEETAGQNIDLTLKYYIDGSTVAYSLQSVGLEEATELGYFIAKFPAINDQQSTFHWLSLSLEYSGKQGPINLYGVKLIYSPVRWE